MAFPQAARNYVNVEFREKQPENLSGVRRASCLASSILLTVIFLPEFINESDARLARSQRQRADEIAKCALKLENLNLYRPVISKPLLAVHR